MSDDWDADEGFRFREESADWGTSQPQEQPQDQQEQQDPVTVALDDEGRFSAVTVDREWRELLDPRRLGEELKEAANKALTDYLAVAVERNLAEAQAQPAAHREAPSANGDPSSATAKNLVNEILDLFGQFDAQFTQFTQALQQVATGDHRGESTTSSVVVTLARGQVTGVEVDEKWSRTAAHTEIGMETLAALQKAQRAAGDIKDVQMPPALARLQQLGSDPEALSRQLGLSR